MHRDKVLALMVWALALVLLCGDLALGDNDPAMDLYYSANSLCSRRFYKLAVTEYKTFLSQYAAHAKAPLAKWGLAISLYNLAQLKEAEPLFKELAGNGAVAAQEQLHNLWGACLLEQKRFPEAEKAFNWSLKNAKDPASEQTANARTGLIEAMFLKDKWANLPGPQLASNYYRWYYGALSMYQHQGDDWKTWNEALRPLLLARPACGSAGNGTRRGRW